MRQTILLILLSVFFYSFITGSQTVVETPSRSSTASAVPVSRTTGNKMALLTRLNFEDHIHALYNQIGLQSLQLDYEIFRLGMIGYYSLEKEGTLSKKNMLTIIDFEQPSTAKRFYAVDLKNKKVLYHTYVAHGRNTGENMATNFSNIPHSNQSSLGFYVTGETYVGSKGYSLRLDGREKSFNDNIRSRAVVIHAAQYATENWIERYGRLGRSQGCPALPPALSREVIDAIKEKTAIFTYYPDQHYLNSSRYLKLDDLFEKLDRQPIPLVAENASQT